MSGPAELSIFAGTLLDVGLKSTAVFAVGLGLSRALRSSSAASRHAVWAVTFASAASLPLWARGAEAAVDLPAIVAVWALGVVVAMAPLALGCWRLQALHRGLPTQWLGRTRVVTTDRVESPLTYGLVRPVVLLPRNAQWSTAERDAALAHEMAHVQRGDWAVHVAVWAICALFWFQPLAWLARRELGREAEHAADDLALAQGIRPSAYAQLLMSVATGFDQVALGVGTSDLSRRVTAVLAPERSRSARRWPILFGSLLLAALLVPGLAQWPTWTAEPEVLTCSPGLLP